MELVFVDMLGTCQYGLIFFVKKIIPEFNIGTYSMNFTFLKS